MKTVGKSFRFIGLVGLIGTLVLNVLCTLVLEKPAAALFTSGWWSTWFVLYVVWLSFLAISGVLSKGQPNKAVS